MIDDRRTTMSMTTEQQKQRMQMVHERLRHDSTTDAPDIVREHMRRTQLVQEREAQTQANRPNEQDYWNS
jgi:hypothetical protein